MIDQFPMIKGLGNATALQSIPVSSTPPTSGQSLAYVSGSNQYEPTTPPVTVDANSVTTLTAPQTDTTKNALDIAIPGAYAAASTGSPLRVLAGAALTEALRLLVDASLTTTGLIARGYAIGMGFSSTGIRWGTSALNAGCDLSPFSTTGGTVGAQRALESVTTRAIKGSGTAPTTTASADAGTGATCSASGNALAFDVELTTGTDLGANGAFTIPLIAGARYFVQCTGSNVLQLGWSSDGISTITFYFLDNSTVAESSIYTWSILRAS